MPLNKVVELAGVLDVDAPRLLRLALGETERHGSHPDMVDILREEAREEAVR